MDLPLQYRHSGKQTHVLCMSYAWYIGAAATHVRVTYMYTHLYQKLSAASHMRSMGNQVMQTTYIHSITY